jgi:microsomal dipeptidase-like Zn-dependent dipeptidase
MGIFKQMVGLVGVEKLLFGSDFPLRIYPGTQKSPDMLHYIEVIRNEAGLTEPELAALLGGNFRRLLG